MQTYECKRCWWLAHSLKDGKSTFWKWYSSWTILCNDYARDPFTSELFRVSLYQETLYSKWATYWVRSAKRITRINCSTQTVRYVNITSNWISEIQQCFWSTQQPYGRIQYFKSQLLHLIFVLISLILSFFVFIIIYAIIDIAYLVINLLMPYVDVQTEAVVISICIKQISWPEMFTTIPR